MPSAFRRDRAKASNQKRVQQSGRVAPDGVAEFPSCREAEGSCRSPPPPAFGGLAWHVYLNPHPWRRPTSTTDELRVDIARCPTRRGTGAPRRAARRRGAARAHLVGFRGVRLARDDLLFRIQPSGLHDFVRKKKKKKKRAPARARVKAQAEGMGPSQWEGGNRPSPVKKTSSSINQPRTHGRGGILDRGA